MPCARWDEPVPDTYNQQRIVIGLRIFSVREGIHELLSVKTQPWKTKHRDFALATDEAVLEV